MQLPKYNLKCSIVKFCYEGYGGNFKQRNEEYINNFLNKK